MKIRERVLVSVILILCLATVSNLVCAGAEKQTRKDTVTLCEIPIPFDLKEAQFVVTYGFVTDTKGKPTNIKKIKNDFLGDEPFQACISGWSLPSISGQGVADFFAKPNEGGWTEITVSGKGFSRSFHYSSKSRRNAEQKDKAQ
ncbi:MAG TPA: hypothetical protein VI685_27300 [Candidatus Angelobacter sp.]